jgi:tetratricopeptide (TPR) repeat protein
MRLTLILLLLLSIQVFCVDKDKYDKVIALISSHDLAGAKSEIDKMTPDCENDPDYYVLVLNYYFEKAATSAINITTEQPDNNKEYLTLKRSDDSTATAYLAGINKYDKTIIEEGLKVFIPAIEKFPDRLDMLYGLVYLYSETGEYKKSGEMLIKILDRSGENKNLWLKSFNEKLDDSYHFMIENIQSYLSKIMESDDENAMDIMFSVSERMVSLYPDNVYGYNNLGYYYVNQQNMSEAQKYFLLAEKINPKDVIVLANLAEISSRQNNASEAEKYYKKIIEYGNEDDRMWAEEKMKTLNK